MKPSSNHSAAGRRLEFWVNLVARLLFVGLALALVATALSTRLLTPALGAGAVAGVGALVAGVVLLGRSGRSGVRAAGAVLSVLLCVVFALGIGYIRIGMSTLERITATVDPETPAAVSPQPPPAPESPFTLYISGSDSRSNDLDDIQRSDVNIIAAVNPKTRQVLLLSTPRDYFVPLSISHGERDKLTHAGDYGIQVSMDTLELLYGVELDYYFRVNFSGFERIIDAIAPDGLAIDSRYDFSSTISPTPIHYNKGVNYLNGYQALYYVRERYSFANGDFQRGIHQMQVIEAVMDRVLSPALLTRYAPTMSAIGDCFRTSVPAELITALVRDQLSRNQEWNVVSYYVTGHEEHHYPYSAPHTLSSVIIPDQDTVDTAQQLLSQVLEGAVISDPCA